MVLPVSIRDANKYLKVRNYSMAIKSFQNIIKEANDYEKVLMDQVFFNLTYALGCVNLNSLYKGNIPRIAVYTAVVGPYDNLQDPLYVAENVDYFVFSDMEISSSVWHRIPLNYYNSSSVKNARFVKINPHLYFENYEISIWIDANIQLIGDVNHIASFLPDENVLGLFGHPHRNCIYVEGEECIKRSKDEPAPILKQLDYYKSNNYPPKNGLWETGVLVRRHNNAHCIKMMSEWWLEVFRHSRRDQISLPYVLHGNNENPFIYGADLRRDLNIIHKKHLSYAGSNVSKVFTSPLRIPVDDSCVSATIVVCVYNALEDVIKCLDSVVKYKRAADKVIIVDDFSLPDTEKYLSEFSSNYSEIKLVRNEVNKGYTKSANTGLKLSDSDYTILLNSDTILTPNAIKNMIVAGEQSSSIGIIGPLSNAATWQSVPNVKGDDGCFTVNSIPSSHTINEVGAYLEGYSHLVNPFCHLVNGFCYAVKRKVIDKIGFLDELSFPVGYGEEDDYSLRSLKAGFISCIAINAFVFHSKSKSFTPEGRKPLAKAGFIKLTEKHEKEFVLLSTETLSENRVMEKVRQDLSIYLVD